MNQPLVLYNLQNTSWLSQTCHHSLPFSAVPSLSQNQAFQAFPKHPCIHLSHHTIHIYIYILDNHGDTTQPCLNPPLTGNHSLTSILTRTHALLSTYKLCSAFSNFPSNPHTLSSYHLPCRSIVSSAFSKSIDVHNKSFPFARYISHTCFTNYTKQTKLIYLELLHSHLSPFPLYRGSVHAPRQSI